MTTQDDLVTVDYNGNTLTLIQLPYADSDFTRGGKSVYRAKAEDCEGNEYTVTWDTIDDDCEDESDACNWDDFTVRRHSRIKGIVIYLNDADSLRCVEIVKTMTALSLHNVNFADTPYLICESFCDTTWIDCDADHNEAAQVAMTAIQKTEEKE